VAMEHGKTEARSPLTPVAPRDRGFLDKADFREPVARRPRYASANEV